MSGVEKGDGATEQSLAWGALGIDHIAIAVPDLDAAIAWYTDKLGFVVTERRVTEGTASGMISAVLKTGHLTFVLLQGTSPQSQICRYIAAFGPGVQHVAIRVNGVESSVETLQQRGVAFGTSIIRGNGLTQAFIERDPTSGLMLELIDRPPEAGTGFDDDSVTSLFEQLEAKSAF